MTIDESPDIETLPKTECWELLQGQVIGRLAVVVDDDHPDIFPINYVVHNGSVIFRTAPGTKLYGSVNNTPVAFEIDGYNPHTEQAWSVVLRGRAQQLESTTGLAKALALQPWQGGEKNHLIRINTLNLSGRRFHVTKPDIWTTPLADARRASFE
ncbi:flavin-nucleotide-binding protein [Arthrobacter sp. ERGS1:01]|uniref:pyridoxamine 5'-phosphate oxidase family protein n=1 Tax=Arthrobacter sp. ERGS1:01 TaxID=1704044 RepID=UPI0006B54351|nr:pyridoxamine 5'-phosphate oxidase family protein [Arthrobacter sp. ERGS1:01]ALE05637.1 flavin-nucleotide-binding protein [Arthrobacter sp. ERGS1:01]